jgi:hypothetical protein
MSALSIILVFSVQAAGGESTLGLGQPSSTPICSERSGLPARTCLWSASPPIFSTREFYHDNYTELSRYVRKVVAKAAGDITSAGDGNTHLVDGLDLLGPSDADAFQEGVHPNDLGFLRIADRLEPTLRRILRLPDVPEKEGDDEA